MIRLLIAALLLTTAAMPAFACHYNKSASAPRVIASQPTTNGHATPGTTSHKPS